MGKGSRSVRKGSMFDFVETMTYRMTAEQIAPLARAKTVIIYIGNFEGPLDERTAATFRNMISLLNP